MKQASGKGRQNVQVRSARRHPRFVLVCLWLSVVVVAVVLAVVVFVVVILVLCQSACGCPPPSLRLVLRMLFNYSLILTIGVF